MATFTEEYNKKSLIHGDHYDDFYYKFFVKNQTDNKEIDFDFESLTKGKFVRHVSGLMSGKIKPHCENIINFDTRADRLANDSVGIIILNHTVINFRFWSKLYINLLSGGGFNVTKDTEEISEITGNGFRVTVDGGGVKDPGTLDIYIQIYNS